MLAREDGMHVAHTIPAPDAELRELVRAHAMHWHLTVEKAVVAGELRPIGLALSLSAVHHRPAQTPLPGCSECAPVVNALERVIDAVLPNDHRRSTYDVDIPTAELEYPRGRRPEITATITILHGSDDINAPIDSCETRCANDIIAKLKALGAHEGSF